MVKPTEFYAGNYVDALASCESAGNEALYMPGVARARIDGSASWGKFYDSRSVRVTGKSKQGNDAVVLYVHTAHPLATAEGVRGALSKGLVNGAARFPKEAFLQLLERDGEKAGDGTYLVKAVPHNILRESPSGVISIDDALYHPQTIPFFGNEALAEQYLQEFSKHQGNNIGIWHSDDLHKDGPLARPLFVGNYYYDGLLGNNDFDLNGRFLGVRASDSELCAEGAKNFELGLEERLSQLRPFVAEVNRKAFEQVYRKLHE